MPFAVSDWASDSGIESESDGVSCYGNTEVLGNVLEFLLALLPRHIISMSTVTPFPWSELPATENTETGFRPIFERAPMAAARCNPQGVIVEMNPAFEQAVNPLLLQQRVLRLSDLVPAEDRDTTESLLHALLGATCDRIRVVGRKEGVPKMGWKLPIGRRGVYRLPEKSLLMFCLSPNATMR